MRLYDVQVDGDYIGAVLARNKDEARFRVAAILSGSLWVAYRTITVRPSALSG